MSGDLGDEVVDTFRIDGQTVTVFGAYAHDVPAGVYEFFDVYLDDDARGVGYCMNEGSPIYERPTKEDAARLLRQYLGTQVVLIETDRDYHGRKCICGLCDSNGHSVAYSATLEEDFFRYYYLCDLDVELVRLYSPSEEAGQHNVKMWAEQQGYTVVRPSETQQALADGACECDNTHAQNGTVCQFCYVREHPKDKEALRMLKERVEHTKEN